MLSACKVHRDLDFDREVGEVLLRLDGDSPVNYIMMSNIYVEAGEWEQCQKVREAKKEKGLKKEVGCSWIGIDKKMHFLWRRRHTPTYRENSRGIEGDGHENKRKYRLCT
uniref:Pentatricopeptide repeat-containing protein n=1 Tax=Nelumbo nucifera TaxID=4432 RepID=A0A822Z986_NELNU|nr:TPA_asm: hypothetical protein HUJ06_014338 [Nelumbo nucifera]